MKFLLIVSMLFIFSCKKDNSCNDCMATNVNATVVWTGDISLDGCDWCIETDSSHFYHPDMLDTSFRHDQLPVTISYELTSENFSCGGSEPLHVIHITGIKK